MLKESLDETLEAAKYCVEYSKEESKWGQFNTGGCLGYPAAILLFSIIDSIGSYHRKNANFFVTIDGKKEKINGDGWEHFKILNSKYFNLSLSLEFIKKAYSNFRSKLTHNSIMGKDALMIPRNDSIEILKGRNVAFIEGFDQDKNKIFVISIEELYNLCHSAVVEFKKDIDVIVPESKQGGKFT